MSKTPTKSNQDFKHFTPTELTSPNKDLPGLPKTAFTHVSNLHSLCLKWIKIRERGVKICKLITSLKLHECNMDYYPRQLKTLTDDLVDILGVLKHIIDSVEIIKNQIQALAKLQSEQQPVINTWSAKQISDNVCKLYSSLKKEFDLKQIITENIAHSRDENLIEVYVSAWELEVYVDVNTSAYLFAEIGLSWIT